METTVIHNIPCNAKKLAAYNVRQASHTHTTQQIHRF